MKYLFPTFFILLLGALLHAQEHNFEYISNHIYLNAEVNGKPARLVFDTGSADVYLDSTWNQVCTDGKRHGARSRK